MRDLRGLPPEILMVPLRGHTFGHAGVAARGPDGWTLLTGDAYFDHRELDPQRPRCTPGLRAYQWLMDKDRSARRHNQARLRSLRKEHARDIEIFCSHERREFDTAAAADTSLHGDDAAIIAAVAWPPR